MCIFAGNCLCFNDCGKPTYCVFCNCVIFFKIAHPKIDVLAISLISVAIGIVTVFLGFIGVYLCRQNPNGCRSIVIYRRANRDENRPVDSVSIQTTPSLSQRGVTPRASPKFSPKCPPGTPDLRGHL